MAEVCGHLMEMVDIVDDFFKFLGPELKVVTGVCVGRSCSAVAHLGCRVRHMVQVQVWVLGPYVGEHCLAHWS